MVTLRPSPLSSSSVSVQFFTLPGLLPAQARLLLDLHTNTAMVLHLENGGLAACHRSFSLTPSATRLFLSLVQAYPACCSFRSLFFALYPLDQEQETNRPWQRDLAVRPIRRALETLSPVLHGLGLKAVSLRGQGYVLAAQDGISLA